MAPRGVNTSLPALGKKLRHHPLPLQERASITAPIVKPAPAPIPRPINVWRPLWLWPFEETFAIIGRPIVSWTEPAATIIASSVALWKRQSTV